MSTTEIRGYLKVSASLITAGQPTADQLREAAAEGFTTVINLATINPRYSLDDEGGLVASLGMTYHHLPVAWDEPTEADFEAFAAVMQQHEQDQTLLHCAANFRVTAFYALYAMRYHGWTGEQAETFRAQLWAGSDYPVWEAFFSAMKAKLSG